MRGYVLSSLYIVKLETEETGILKNRERLFMIE